MNETAANKLMKSEFTLAGERHHGRNRRTIAQFRPAIPAFQCCYSQSRFVP
jgi:hypothetical protein